MNVYHKYAQYKLLQKLIQIQSANTRNLSSESGASWRPSPEGGSDGWCNHGTPWCNAPTKCKYKKSMVQLGLTLPRRATAPLHCTKVLSVEESCRKDSLQLPFEQLHYIPGDNMVCKTNRFIVQDCRSLELSFESVHLKTLL